MISHHVYTALAPGEEHDHAHGVRFNHNIGPAVRDGGLLR